MVSNARHSLKCPCGHSASAPHSGADTSAAGAITGTTNTVITLGADTITLTGVTTYARRFLVSSLITACVRTRFQTAGRIGGLIVLLHNKPGLAAMRDFAPPNDRLGSKPAVTATQQQSPVHL